VHDIDSIRWVTGREVASVYAVGTNRGDDFFTTYDDVDTLTALLTLDDDTLATVSCTRYNAAGYDVRLEVLGSAGSVSVGLDDRTPLRSTEPGVPFPAGPAYPMFPERFAGAYAAELTAFLTLARDGGTSPCTPADALEAFYVAEAGELSRRESRPVAISEVRR
jgi:myo-inositol 2-dehydrogenase/D-chiro-inositol 1-dehydrogenase